MNKINLPMEKDEMYWNEQKNKRRHELILMKIKNEGGLTECEKLELNTLKIQCRKYIHKKYPLPIKKIKLFKEMLEMNKDLDEKTKEILYK